MKNHICPYCGEKLEDSSELCPNCNRNLIVQCPYCKQNIKAYEEICPFCTTKLSKTDYMKYANIIGIVLSIIWAIFSALFLLLFWKFPEILNYKDKNGDSENVMSTYIAGCLRYGIIVTIPFLIAAINKHKQKVAITAIAINATLMIIFSITAIYLKFGR